ncbi:spore coat protein CotZ [Lysinibacillus yapensis]|uniref:Spore coat protein CotZ n=1 Tax=Ureibacillus yapensis TaxID=2304605 RepID=A0A396STP1_9BACL|nr:CotY/CotZ family spore coat protein [Lysinibacillus yapensis]RHW39851.1 spore coat protein CotZ [Lysinibacillus yapensis]
MGCGRKDLESSSREDFIHDEGCICEVVKTILKLQNHAVRHDDKCGTSCFVEPIGGLSKHGHADTRVFMLLDKHGKPFTVLARKRSTWQATPFFRVEDVFGDCCATLRAVAYNFETGAAEEVDEEEADTVFLEGTQMLDPIAFGEIKRFRRTETCVTVDLNDFTAIQCIADVDLNIHHH